MNLEKRLMVLLALLAEQSGEKVSETRLEFTAKRLAPLGMSPVCVALEKLLDSSRRFPTVAEVQAAMGIAEPTTRDEAMLIVETIMGAIAKYGEVTNLRTALAVELALGPAVWEIVKRQGGWNGMLDRCQENESAFRAQLRDMAEAYFRTGLVTRGEIPEATPSLYHALSAVDRNPELLEQVRTGQRLELEKKRDEYLNTKQVLSLKPVTR